AHPPPPLFPYTTLFRSAAVLLGDVVDQLLDEHGLADAGAPEEACLAAPRIRLQQIDDLDAGLEHLDLGRLVLERGRGPVDRVRRSEEHTSELQSPDHLV